MNTQQEPARGTPDRRRAVRAHLDRVIRIFEHKNPGIGAPVELTQLRDRTQPECECEESKPRAAHGTFLCLMCGGISVPLTPPVDMSQFPKDDLGNLPIAVRGGSPIVCSTCKAKGKTIYARFAKREQKLWCPVCHEKPKSESFTSRLLSRKKKVEA